ncbi:MAG: hypothetical protein ACREGF_04685, partial [Candidatus Saccharimonadales bacterium]
MRKLQPLHSAEEIAAQIAADENVPANIDQPGQTPEPAAETGQSPSSEDSAEPVSPPAIANNEIVPAIDISNSYAVPLHTDDAAPSAQTTPPAPPLADEPEPVIAPVVVGSGIQATPPANLPNTASFSPANPAASGLVNPPFTPSPPPSSPKKRGKILKFLPVAIVVIILAAGGSAAYAYVKYYQPEHNLETALNNTLQQKQIHYTGTLSTDPTSPQALPAYKVTFTGQSDLASKSTDVQVNLTIDGVTFPVEARLVDQNLYFKLGDLNEIIGLVNSLAPSEAPLVKSLSSQLFNKWIEVDSTLLKKAGASCELDSNLNLTAADMKIVDQQLQKHQFVTIKSMASSSLSGRAAEEYSLQLNDNKLADFAKNLNQLSAVKALQTCSGQKSNPPLNTKSIADNDTTPITIWV